MWRRHDRDTHRTATSGGDGAGFVTGGPASSSSAHETNEITETCNALGPANRHPTGVPAGQLLTIESKLDNVIVALHRNNVKIGNDAAGEAVFKVVQAVEGKLKPSSSTAAASSASTTSTNDPDAFAASFKALSKALYVIHCLCKAQDVSLPQTLAEPRASCSLPLSDFSIVSLPCRSQ